jgi:hypothetical protein
MLLPRIDWFVIVDFLATFTARLEGPFRHAAERHPTKRESGANYARLNHLQ